MISGEEDLELMRAQGDAPDHVQHGAGMNSPSARKPMGFGQKCVVTLLLSVVLVPPAAAFLSYFFEVPLHVLGATRKEGAATPAKGPSVSVLADKPNVVDVPDEVCIALGIVRSGRESIAVAKPPTTSRPLEMPGSTMLDPTRLARIRARFPQTRVVEIAKVWDYSRKTGGTEFRELRMGDRVSKGDLIAVFYSADVGSKKNDLLDALVQLELDETILQEARKHAEAVPGVFLITYERAVQGDRNAIGRALNNLKVWDIPQNEIDELRDEAKKLAADKNAWSKTPEGRWVKGEKQTSAGVTGPDNESANPWGKVSIRAPFDGVVVERNVHVGEMVVDNTVNLFQIADVNRLLVVANCPEDDLPILEELRGVALKWSVHTVGADTLKGLSGTIDDIGYLIDPNQHTAVIKGFVENPRARLRAGQYVKAVVNIPPPEHVVEIPSDALLDDGSQSVVFVQPDSVLHKYAMRRVQVVRRYDRTVFVASEPPAKEEAAVSGTDAAEAGLLPIERLAPGERVLTAGTVELKAVIQDFALQTAKTPAEKKD